jgi:DNA replication and repair protein RecF
MAESSTAIAASRLDYIQKLQAEINSSSNDHFPKARLELKGFVEEQSLKQPSLSIEDELKSLWRSSRTYDSEHGGSQYGVHRTDLDVYFVNKNREAHLSSTGEQKSLLIGIILAQARFIKRAHGTPPIILLDEIAAHLDDTRRQYLYQNLSDIGSQIFLTGTDRMLFDHLSNAQKFTVKEGGILSL